MGVIATYRPMSLVGGATGHVMTDIDMENAAGVGDISAWQEAEGGSEVEQPYLQEISTQTPSLARFFMSLDGMKGVIEKGLNVIGAPIRAAKAIGEGLADKSDDPTMPALAFAASAEIAVGAAPVGVISLLMAGRDNGARQAVRGRRVSSELIEERVGRWLETKLKAFFQGKFWLGIKKLIWDPPVIEESNFKMVQRFVGHESMPKWTFIMHAKGKPLTDLMVRTIKRFIGDAWKDSAEPKVLEVGAGSGALSKAVTEETGARVLEVDLFNGAESAGHRMIADMTKMDRVQTRSMRVVFSSFAFEYEGLPAAREIFRVMEEGGHFVALVHHKGSAIARHVPILDELTIFLASFRPIRLFTPKIFLDLFVHAEALRRQLSKAAFDSRGKAEKMLTTAGFADVTLDTVDEPLRLGAKPRDIGWLITARKPAKRK